MKKFEGIFPAFYACYNDNGDVSKERAQQLTNYLIEKGVNGLYVCGSSGECVYQTTEERKEILEAVVKANNNRVKIIAHIAAPSTRESIVLAKHAESLGVDAIAAIPPIYFRLPEHSIYEYWTDMVNATSLDFIIYNIPQTTGYQLSKDLFKKMIENKKVIGVKNSSMPVMDIEQFKSVDKENVVVFNGPDEQFVAGRLMGADGGIGGTYGAMPELFIKANEFIKNADLKNAFDIQSDINSIIMDLCSFRGNMYAVIKEILRLNGVDTGGVRKPLTNVSLEELPRIKEVNDKIKETIRRYHT